MGSVCRHDGMADCVHRKGDPERKNTMSLISEVVISLRQIIGIDISTDVNSVEMDALHCLTGKHCAIIQARRNRGGGGAGGNSPPQYLSSTKKQHISNSLRLDFYHPRCQEVAFSTFKSKIILGEAPQIPLCGLRAFGARGCTPSALAAPWSVSPKIFAPKISRTFLRACN
jgi:hypothetical protein